MNKMMNVNKGENFDIQQLMNVVGQSAMTTNQISNQLGIISTAVTGLKSDVYSLCNRMDSLELNEEVTTTQQEVIIETAKKRVCEVLGFNDSDISKYIRTFIQKLYSDARSYAGMGSKISRTKKADYQRVVDYVGAWNPRCGVTELKNIADKRAKSRLEAKMLRY